MDEVKPRYTHLPVMPVETLRHLAPQPGQVVVDGTVGLGGHSRLFAEAIGPDGRLVCLDRDPEALRLARDNLSGVPCRVDFVNSPFEGMAGALSGLGIAGADRIFLDLGVSSLQLDKPERGFSFRQDGPLDMRMNQSVGVTAGDIVNTWPAERLRDLFKRLGEERFSGRIAKTIVEKRVEKPIESTGELSALVEAAVPFRGRIHPATRIFQALRMEVNDELGTLLRGLAVLGRLLKTEGRLGVLTFHSLEDRLVKKTFLKWQELGVAAAVTKGAVAASREESLVNRRARSAKLRVVERL
ncbi:MAG: 16S rRNA (cytosine(1402)-N(4))-methyltransferase RsmH [Planctomycetes bacterium]|nr:16S rRNA (cytosine(1402)-N(4))-methyltransferase RsmH [Planctomycetota bacterium]MCD7896728.1 16S rRNA (cytosine(1402)-N(4))-methyltransferase RsmH [Planctomycetaceae bacterium]